MIDLSHRRKIASLVMLLVLFVSFFSFPGLASPVRADHTPDPTSVTLAGSLQSELGCPGDWQPECATTHLVDQGNGVWRGQWMIPAGSYEYKMALNDNWTESYAGNHTNSGNTTLDLTDPVMVTFYYDHKTHAVLDSVMDQVAVVAGSFQSELGCAGDWMPDCVQSLMTDPDGDGIYSFETSALPAGNYEFKVALNESWGTSYPADNVAFTVPANNAKVVFRYNATTHLVSVSTGHGHDNNVEYDGLAHNSQSDVYRTPFGAVNPGTPVTLRFRTYHDDATGVRVRVYDTATQSQFFRTMTPAATSIDCYGGVPASETCDFWTTTITPTQIGTLYYRFIVSDGTATAYYADDEFQDGGVGVATPNEIDNSYVITVFDPAFQPIGWMQNAVIYQIFPDRFRNGDPTNDLITGTVRYDDPVIELDWAELPEGYCRKYTDAASNCPWRFDTTPPDWSLTVETPRGRDYMGGDLKGVRQKLDYLKQLGVTVIYFNPVFDSASNHGYDTQDYYHIDPAFGTETDWDMLTAAANLRGIKIVVDGVFNHVSSDSIYFDRYGHFAETGACESVNSPYRSWFYFTPLAGGPCAGPNGANTMTYDAWFGFDSLPVLNKNNSQVRDLVYAANDSVAKYWLNNGAAGWRLDVMGDGSFPANFWQGFRDSVKAARADAPIIGELWKKGEVLPKIHGDQADTTMNYRFRNAILGYFGTVDDKGFVDDGDSYQPPSLFARKIMSTREDYPDAVFYTLMNLMDSHDTERILWTLTPTSGAPENRASKEFNAANLAQGKANLRMAAAVQMTMPGAPTIYYGDEVALTGDDDPDDRRTYPWGDANNTTTEYQADPTMLAYYQKLTQVRGQNMVLRNGDIKFLLTKDDSSRVMAYGRRNSTSVAIVAINPSATSQTLVVSTTGYVRDGVNFTNALSTTQTASTSGGALAVMLPANTAGIFLANIGQDLTPTAAPTNLVATPGNGDVGLTWSSVAGASGYNIYRSQLSGGGYALVGTSATTAYTDTSVVNGNRYYYVVTALDSAGNESAWSNEAAATPAFTIGYAVLQSPKEVTTMIGITPTALIYGQVYVAGLTDASASCTNVLAQLGYGTEGSDPTTWTTWKPMECNPGYDFSTSNDEYQGTLRPEAVGTFDLLVRFSTDGGLTWSYGDKDGYFPGESGTDDPGKLHVLPNSDTTPPAAPQNLRVTNWSQELIALAWDAVPDAALYRVYRSTITGTFDYNAPLVEVLSTTLAYTDTDVTSGVTYHYVVKAYDAALNASAPSNEVTQQAEQRLVQVTFRVRVPAETPDDDIVYIAGNNAQAFGAEWNPGFQPMTRIGPDLWEYTATVLDGVALQYKYTRGSWDRVEWWGSITSTANREVTVNYGSDGTQLVDDTSTDWGNGPDTHKAVQHWRDPLVASASPTAAADTAPTQIVVTWSTPVTATGALSDVIIVRTSWGSIVTGTVALSDTDTFVWTPNAPLPDGAYTITAFNVKRADIGGEATPMQKPYVWTLQIGPYKLYLPLVLRG